MPSYYENLRSVITKETGSIFVFLDANRINVADYAKQLTRRNPPSQSVAQQIKVGKFDSPECQEWLCSELRDAISDATLKWIELGYDQKTLRKLVSRAYQSDVGTAFAKGLFSNFIAYGITGLISLSIMLPLSLFLGPLPLIFLGLSLSLIGAYLWSVHAVTCAPGFNREFDATQGLNGGRGRFSRALPPVSVRSAIRKEIVANSVRAGTRSLVLVPLQAIVGILGALGVATTCASAISMAIGPIALILDAPTSAAMQALSEVLHGQNGRRTFANLFGIGYTPATGIRFSPSTPGKNIRRLEKTWAVRSVHTFGRLAAFYSKNFASAFAKERANGMDRNKWIRFWFGANASGQAFGDAVAAVGAAIGGPLEAGASAAGDIATTISESTYAVSREPVLTAIGKSHADKKSGKDALACKVTPHVRRDPVPSKGLSR